MKKYKIKELFYTLQGEGFHSGRPAVFCRFSGCNLWSGREEDRNSAICSFCDTDFRGTNGINGGEYTAEDLANKITGLMPYDEQIFVVCTGGEPALQLDDDLIRILHEHQIEIAVETNGTKELPEGIDWICVSPKEDASLIVKKGNELKLVFPQLKNIPQQFENLEFTHFYLQPLDGENLIFNTQKCINYCLQHPKWKLSIQSHKLLGIP